MPQSEPQIPMTELDELIRQAELQQKQMQLELQFQKNMALFKKFAQAIYEEFNNYKPSSLHLQYDQDGFINLINTKTGKPVYDEDPEVFCKKQFSSYRSKPHYIKIGFTAPKETYFFQHPLVKKLIDKQNESPEDFKPSLKKPIGMMIINGVGLGYHIQEIINNSEIYTLCIFEPNKDSFYASLHTIDWSPIIEHFYRRGKLLKLFIENSAENTITSFRLLTNQIGLHSITNTYVYHHLMSDKTEEFITEIQKQFHLTATGVGFLEDEQVGFAHTIDSLNKNIAVFNGNKTKKLPPAIIVGNGPSLDGLMETLREIGEHCIVFSCGTTTGTLYKENYTPDFHIEMERLNDTTECVLNGTDSNFRKNITLLALNTVAPETMALFDRKCMALKANDAGEDPIYSVFNRQVPYLNLSNPTCTNTGLSYALQMGFEEIYLIGVDLGMADDDKHHASSSIYFHKDESKRPDVGDAGVMARYRAKGNFVEEVKTTATFDTSRANMVLAIAQFPHTKVYNLNNGAYIKGAIPLEKQKVNVKPILLSKNSIVEHLLNHSFTAPDLTSLITEQSAKDLFLTKFFATEEKLHLPKNIKNVSELQQRLNEIHLAIADLKGISKTSYWLLTGSIQSFSAVTLKGCLRAKNEFGFQEAYRFHKQVYDVFLKNAFSLMKNECLKHGDINKSFAAPAK